MISGGRFNPGVNPPGITYQPWYHLIVVDTFSSAQIYDVPKIASKLRSQIDPTKHGFNWKDDGNDPFRLQFRLQTVRCWSLSGMTIALAVEDFADLSKDGGGRDQVCGLVDMGNQNHVPAIGFELPQHLKGAVLRNDDLQAKLKLFTVLTDKDMTAVVYINLNWRFDGPITLPTFISYAERIMRIGRQIANSNDKHSKYLSEIESNTEEIAKHTSSSIIEAVIDGAKVAAQVVVPAARVEHPSYDSLLRRIELLELSISEPIALESSSSSFTDV